MLIEDPSLIDDAMTAIKEELLQDLAESASLNYLAQEIVTSSSEQ